MLAIKAMRSSSTGKAMPRADNGQAWHRVSFDMEPLSGCELAFHPSPWLDSRKVLR